MTTQNQLSVRTLALTCLALTSVCSAVAQPLPVAKPESVGMSTQRLEKITAALAQDVADKKLPGAVVMVARKGKLVYSQSFGNLNNAAAGPMQSDSIFRIYSMTKPLASTALMMLLKTGGCS